MDRRLMSDPVVAFILNWFVQSFNQIWGGYDFFSEFDFTRIYCQSFANPI